MEAPSDETGRARDGLVALTAVAMLVGVLAGVVGAAFRAALVAGDGWRDAAVAWADDAGIAGAALVLAACAAAAATAAWLVTRFARYASGSGIPHVEAVVRDELPPASLSLLPVKFAGGWLAIASGLVLGREGPSVQMGACLGSLLGERARLGRDDQRALLAAGAGAGLAVAFNAPTAGAVFVLEELVRRFDTRIAIAALAASASAIAVAQALLGHAPDFSVTALLPLGIGASVPFVALGLAAGLAGVAYNATIRGTLAFADRLVAVPPVVRAALVGAAIGAVTLAAPRLVGGGDPLTQEVLSGRAALATLPLVFLARFALGPISYAAGTPGGLFAPLLVLGAQLGAACAFTAGHGGEQPVVAGYAMVGMAAFFAAVVRSPLTGMVLVTEMTGSLVGLLPMVIASAMAMLVATIAGDPPIYDSLRERLLRAEGGASTTRSSRCTSSSLPL